MLGAIIGDIVGSIYEFHNIKTKDFPLLDATCFFTDDTVMTIAVAEALLNGATTDSLIESMKKFGRIYRNADYGLKFRQWLLTNTREPYNSWGNGSAMRVSPCAWYADSLEEAEACAELSAAVTHNHPEGIKGAQATAAAIYLARTGKTHAEIKEYIERKYGYDLNRTLDGIRTTYLFNETCQETVPEAIIAFLESHSFEDAIRNAVSLGGDSDTLAAITGSIAEAAYRVPGNITTEAFHYLDDELSKVINNWLDSGRQIGAVAKNSDWKTREFSNPYSLETELHLAEKQFARVRFGFIPEEMEDRWFVYFADERLHFHRSWTGFKIFEARVDKAQEGYAISEILVEHDPEFNSSVDDDDDDRLFRSLLFREILGTSIDPSSVCETG